MEASDSLVVPVTEVAALATSDTARRFEFRLPKITYPCAFKSKDRKGVKQITGRTFEQTNCLGAILFGSVGTFCTYFYICNFWPHESIIANTKQFCPPQAPHDKTYINDKRMFADHGWPWADSPTNPSDFTGDKYQCILDTAITTRDPALDCNQKILEKGKAAAVNAAAVEAAAAVDENRRC